MVYQYAINTAKVFDLKELEGYLDLISIERKKRISKFYFTKDKVQSLFAEIILRYILYKRYSFRNDQIKLGYSDYGKPYIVTHSNIHFNLSHSGSWVLCAVGDVPLGIDVEIIKDKDLDISGRIYTKEENDFLFAKPPEDRINTFYKFWTLKESYVKNVGKGLSIPFDSFSFQINKDEIKFLVEGRQNKNFRFYTNQLDNLHCTSLCVNSRPEEIVNENIRILTLNELLEWKEHLIL